MKKFLKYWPIIIIATLTFLTRFWNLSYPKNVVFDESHFGLYATKYLSGQYYFDIHPPLGKMIYGLAAWLAGVKPGFYFAVNSNYGDFNYLALRMLPALFGSFLILLVYFFVKKIGLSERVAFLSSFLVLFNNALIVESQLILINIFLLFFIFLTLFLFVSAQKHPAFSKKWYLLNLLCGVCLGAAGSIKWPGFGAVILVLFLSFFKKRCSEKEALIKIGFFVLLPLIIYIGIFYLHFSLLPFECQNNCGQVLDDFLKECPSCSFVNSLPQSASFFQSLIYVHKWMFLGNFSPFGSYVYGSHWWQWPLMIRPLLYFTKTVGQAKFSYIFLIGNPIAWGLSTFGIIGCLSLLVLQRTSKKKNPNMTEAFPSILTVGYFIFWIPFTFVGRFMLLYLYFPALIFSNIIFACFLDHCLKMRFNLSNDNRIFPVDKKPALIFISIIALIVIGFLLWAPLTYGIFLSDKHLNILMGDFLF